MIFVIEMIDEIILSCLGLIERVFFFLEKGIDSMDKNSSPVSQVWFKDYVTAENSPKL